MFWPICHDAVELRYCNLRAEEIFCGYLLPQSRAQQSLDGMSDAVRNHLWPQNNGFTRPIGYNEDQKA